MTLSAVGVGGMERYFSSHMLLRLIEIITNGSETKPLAFLPIDNNESGDAGRAFYIWYWSSENVPPQCNLTYTHRQKLSRQTRSDWWKDGLKKTKGTSAWVMYVVSLRWPSNRWTFSNSPRKSWSSMRFWSWGKTRTLISWITWTGEVLRVVMVTSPEGWCIAILNAF